MKQIIFNSIITCIILATFISCDTVTSKLFIRFSKSSTEEIAEKGAKKIISEISEEISESSIQKFVGKSLLELASSNKTLKMLYDDFSKRISKEFADGIIVSSTENGIELISKEFPNSAIRINGNILIAKGGSLKNSGPMNEFLNILLPNKTYIVDDVFMYKTDDLGRVVTCTGERSKAYLTIERNAQRNSHIQKHIVNSLDGKVGVDDGGHLFANNTGGPNELINQIPMLRELNQRGLWRQLETIEEKALKEGKKVFSQRKLLYRGNEKRPYAIEFISEIDGVVSRTMVENT